MKGGGSGEVITENLAYAPRNGCKSAPFGGIIEGEMAPMLRHLRINEVTNRQSQQNKK
jgi:hypothetical protein